MSNRSKIIISILILAAAGGGWLWLQGHKADTSQTIAKGIWYCPMHPHYTSDKPGVCPICQMNLVKKRGNPRAELQQQIAEFHRTSGVQGYTTILVPAQKQQLIGLKTQLVGRKSVVKTIRAAGHVSTNHDLYMFQDEYVRTYTQFVKAYRDTRRFEHLRRNWEAHREIQIKLHEAEDKLLRLGLGAHQIEQLQKVSWKTPWNQPDLLFLKDHFEYWVVAQIFEGDLGFVEVGQEADIDIPSYKEKAKGIIRSIGGTVDPDTRTTNALIELKGYRGELKGNMFVNVAISAPLNEAIMVPRDAVMDTGVRKVVFVQKEEGTFEPRDIQTGWETDEGCEVLSGLKEGERIVVSGNFLLDSESRVQAGLEEGK